MKYLILFIAMLFSTQIFAQNLQLHYDFRHTVDPSHNSNNFPTLYFEYFKAENDTTSFIKPGAFFLKVETDMLGSDNNIGKAFIQTSQSFRFWKPKIFLSLQYSGGLGVTEPKQYSYYISNSLSAGPTYAFSWQGAFFSTGLSYVYNMLKRPSNDVMLSFYWGKGLHNYKMEFNGDFEVYTVNKNTGDDLKDNLKGKTVLFFGEPQLWFNLHKGFAMGTKAIMYYHILTAENLLQVYPTIAARFKF